MTIYKNIKQYVIYIGMILAIATALAGDLTAQSSPKGNVKTFKIYMITWIGNTAVERGFTSYLLSREVPVEFILRQGDLKVDNIKAFKKEIREIKPDLIYIVGTPSGLEMYGPHDKIDPTNHITDIPIISVLTATPVESKIIKEWGETGRNICGISHMPPIDSQVKAIKSYMDFKKVGTLFNPQESNSVSSIAELEKIGLKEGFSVIKTPLSINPETKKPIIDEIPNILKNLEIQGAEIVYIPSDAALVMQPKIVDKGLQELNIPSFAPIENIFLQTKVLMGLISRFYAVGEFAGYKAEQILVNKKSPSQMNFDRLPSYSFAIRKETFNRLKAYPPINVLKYAEVVE